MTSETCFLTTKDFTILEVMRDRCLGRDDTLALILKRKIETATVMFRDDIPVNVATLSSRVTFSVDGKELHATLDDIAPEVDAASRTYVAEGTVDTRAACGDTCVALAGRVVHVALGPR